MCRECLSDPQVFEPEIFCVHCRTAFLSEAVLDEEGRCRLCRAGITQFDAAYGYTSYDGRTRKLIHLLKYAGMRPLAAPLGRWLVRALPREARYDALVPVPMHWWKQFRRGFNQSELLANEVSRQTGLPVRRALLRSRSAAVQAGLSVAERRRNVKGIFEHAPSVPVDGARLLLIDDVMTSGVTVNACAGQLKRAGAARVEVLTLARTDRRYYSSFDDPDLSMSIPVRGAFV